MADTNSLRGETVVETLVNMSSEETRGETAVETIANIVGYDVPDDLIGAILAMVGAPDDLRGETVVETIANIVHTFDADADVPDNLIDALVMLNEASGGEPYSDGKNLFAVSAASDGYLGDDGSLVESAGSNHPLTSGFVPVKPGQSLALQAWALTTSASGDGSIWLAYCFYDSNRESIGSTTGKYGGTTLASGQAYSTYEITVPNGAAYIRATYRRVLGGYAKLEYGEDATAWTPAPQDVTVILNEASILHADNAATMPPLTTTVFGKSTQDGTPTPSAPVPIVSVQSDSGGNISLKAQGPNVAHPLPRTIERVGITATVDEDGWITVSGTSTTTSSQLISIGIGSTDTSAHVIEGAPSFALYMETEGTPLVLGQLDLQIHGMSAGGTPKANYFANSATFTNATGHISRIHLFAHTSSNGKTYSGRFRFSLVRGDQIPTEYIPYVETVVPIDLDGHELRSLPDGTRDFVTVGIDGKVTLVQQVGVMTLDGSEKWSASSVPNIAYRTMSGARLQSYVDNALCDHFAVSLEALANMADPSFKIGKTAAGTGELLYFKSSAIVTSVDDLKTWLASNQTTVTYPLAEPVTHDLGYVELPSLLSPVFNMSVAAGGEPTLMTRYLRGRQSTTTSGKE